MSDMKKLLEAMDQFAGQAVGQKPGDQVRGTEKAKPRKDGKHPFAGRLVGANESIIKELDKTAKETAIQRKLAEAYEEYEYDDEDEEDEQPNGFYVAISSEDSGVFVGMITKQGSKWRESTVHGTPPYKWGSGYMSYLTPEDIMQWIRKDYGRSYDVEGPFFDDSEVQDYIDMMSEGIVGRAIAKGKDMLDRLDGNPNPNNLINQKRKEKQDQRKKQSQQPQQGVLENQEVDASVVVGKLHDIIDHTEDMIKNADFDRQVQYATTVRDRAVKALNMIKTNPRAAVSAWKYFQNGQQGVAEGQLDEYGNTPKGQKMLTKVQKRAVDRVTSKKADTDPKYARKNQQSANAAWERMSDKEVDEDKSGVDTVKMDVPLMIRMLEYAREDAQTDMDLHDVAERMIKLGQGDRTLTMDDYDKICVGQEQGVAEEQEAKYGDKYQAAVKRVGQKAKAQEKRKPVDIQALAAKLAAMDKQVKQLKEVNTVAPNAPTTAGGAPATQQNQADQDVVNTQKNLSKLKAVNPQLNPGLANQALQNISDNPQAPVAGAQMAQTKNLADLVGDALADPQKGPQVATMLSQVQQAQKLKK